MALMEPEDRPELPDSFASISTSCPEGANLRQAYEHMQMSKVIDSFSSLQIAELKTLAKGLLSLYIGQQITVAKMAKQDFGIDGV